DKHGFDLRSTLQESTPKIKEAQDETQLAALEYSLKKGNLTAVTYIDKTGRESAGLVTADPRNRSIIKLNAEGKERKNKSTRKQRAAGENTQKETLKNKKKQGQGIGS